VQGIQWVKVDYKSNYLVVKFYHMAFSEAVGALVKTKSDSWDHEKEWRIVAPNLAGQYVQIPEGVLTGIILGLKCPEPLEKLVRGWNNNRAQPVNLFRVKSKFKSFELEMDPA
jgi:hypothetical protein